MVTPAYGWLQMCTNACKCAQIFTNAHKCLQMLTHVYKCSQMFTNAHFFNKYSQMFTNAHRCLQKLTDVPTFRCSLDVCVGYIRIHRCVVLVQPRSNCTSATFRLLGDFWRKAKLCYGQYFLRNIFLAILSSQYLSSQVCRELVVFLLRSNQLTWAIEQLFPSGHIATQPIRIRNPIMLMMWCGSESSQFALQSICDSAQPVIY